MKSEASIKSFKSNSSSVSKISTFSMPDLRPKTGKSNGVGLKQNPKPALITKSQTSSKNQPFLKKKQATIDLPPVTAEAFCIAHVGFRFELITGQKHLTKRKIASLTKIMSLYCSLKLAKFFGIDPQHEAVRVSTEAGAINGTRAELNEGDYILVEDLFHALMLPSGNDAALVLADYFGRRLQGLGSYKTIPNDGKRVQLFVQYMNKIAYELKLSDTKLFK